MNGNLDCLDFLPTQDILRRTHN